jgi:hypothetical protein
VVPHIEIVDLAQHVDVARHRRRVAQPHRDQHTALHVELRRLAEVVDPIEEAEPRRVRRRHPAQLLLDVEPDRHRIDPDVLARQARQEEFTAVLALEQGPEGVGHLEPTLVIDASRRVAPKHATLLHL